MSEEKKIPRKELTMKLGCTGCKKTTRMLRIIHMGLTPLWACSECRVVQVTSADIQVGLKFLKTYKEK